MPVNTAVCMFRAETVIRRMSPLGNFLASYCSPQVKHMLAHICLRGGIILDSCGSKVDAVYRVLTDEGLHVLTNDINGRLTADTHLDVLTSEFLQQYGPGDRQPQWIVTSPPYKHAFAILRQALVVARVGVIFKLRLSFLERTKTRGTWLQKPPPALTLLLPRAVYRGRICSVPEAWIMWDCGKSPRSPLSQEVVFAV